MSWFHNPVADLAFRITTLECQGRRSLRPCELTWVLVASPQDSGVAGAVARITLATWVLRTMLADVRSTI